MDGKCCTRVGVKAAVVGTQFGSSSCNNIAACINDVVGDLEIIVIIDEYVVIEFFNLIGIALQSLNRGDGVNSVISNHLLVQSVKGCPINDLSVTMACV